MAYFLKSPLYAREPTDRALTLEKEELTVSCRFDCIGSAKLTRERMTRWILRTPMLSIGTKSRRTTQVPVVMFLSPACAIQMLHQPRPLS